MFVNYMTQQQMMQWNGKDAGPILTAVDAAAFAAATDIDATQKS